MLSGCLLYQQCRSLQKKQVGGIKHIEAVFEPSRSRLSVIQRKQRKSKKAEVLQVVQIRLGGNQNESCGGDKKLYPGAVELFACFRVYPLY